MFLSAIGSCTAQLKSPFLQPSKVPICIWISPKCQYTQPMNTRFSFTLLQNTSGFPLHVALTLDPLLWQNSAEHRSEMSNLLVGMDFNLHICIFSLVSFFPFPFLYTFLFLLAYQVGRLRCSYSQIHYFYIQTLEP